MRIDSLALDVSGTCNLACRYCFESATLPPRSSMPEDTLTAAWRLLFPDGQPRKGCSIRLGSGEPLLAMPLLRRLDALIRESGGSAHVFQPAVFLTTNGTVASPEVREWLAGSGWHVKISVDGPPSVQDRWRPYRGGTGTSACVSGTLTDLARRMPERLSATAVLCRGADPEEAFGFIAGLGVRRIELVPAAHADPAIAPGPEDAARYSRFVRDYAGRWLGGDPPPVLVRFETCVRRVMGYNQTQFPCAAGRSFHTVAPGGEIYPCFRFVGLPGFQTGDVFAGLDENAATRFQSGPGRACSARAPCNACPSAPLCGGPCFAVASMIGPGKDLPLPVHCAFTKANARAAQWLVGRLRRNPEPLLAFLPGTARSLVPPV